ncbi:MAG: hypothetical protein J1F40_01900 [Prevotellaceae bacterium]|nr:hypothetical protein [Prevotellaceae bacterium]
MDHKEIMLQIVSTRDWGGMNKMLGSLSNMEFRRMERVMREEVLSELDNNAFWEALLHIIIYKRTAFISCVVAIEHLADAETLRFNGKNVEQLYAYLKETHPQSIVKLCNMMIPHLRTEKQMREMFKAFHIDNDITRLSILLKVDSPSSYYMIFKTLKLIEDKTVARKCCMAIIKRHNDMAFNMVSFTKVYFGLEDLPARFSLNVEQYELSHIDRDFDAFMNILNGKRPKI